MESTYLQFILRVRYKSNGDSAHRHPSLFVSQLRSSLWLCASAAGAAGAAGVAAAAVAAAAAAAAMAATSTVGRRSAQASGP